jgi:hypothetical protein
MENLFGRGKLRTVEDWQYGTCVGKVHLKICDGELLSN